MISDLLEALYLEIDQDDIAVKPNEKRDDFQKDYHDVSDASVLLVLSLSELAICDIHFRNKRKN